MKKIVLALALVASPAAASDWWIATMTSELVAFVDRASLTRKGDTISAWSKIYNKEPSRGAASYVVNHRWNCSDRTASIVHINTHGADGTAQSNDAIGGQPQPIAPDTPTEGIFNAVCGNVWPQDGNAVAPDTFVRIWREGRLDSLVK